MEGTLLQTEYTCRGIESIPPYELKVSSHPHRADQRPPLTHTGDQLKTWTTSLQVVSLRLRTIEKVLGETFKKGAYSIPLVMPAQSALGERHAASISK